MTLPLTSLFASCAAALLLAACTSPAPDGANTASVREERTTPIGTYLPRKKGQTANNAGTVSDIERENMRNSGVGTGAMTQH
jgi:outer membrane biogenesis lipoprotein LolB